MTNGTTAAPGVVVVPCESAERVEQARALVVDYVRSLGIDLAFQQVDDELTSFPSDYALPDGGLWLACRDGRPIGCAALRRLDAESCEMKRLYVRPEGRGVGAGRALVTRLIAEARRRGYRRMRLDTLPTMTEARALYLALGFQPIPAYRHNPIPGTTFLELCLDPHRDGASGGGSAR